MSPGSLPKKGIEGPYWIAIPTMSSNAPVIMSSFPSSSMLFCF